MALPTQPQLICHVVYKLDFGGLENGLVNLINRLPRGRFRHAVVALTQSTAFADRIDNPDVTIHALDKRPGNDLRTYVRLFKLLRQIRPSVVHTRNLGTLDCQLVAWAAGVPVRIHSEHGWDVYDPEGREPRYVRLRRVVDRFVHRYVALSTEIQHWLTDYLRIGDAKVLRICNGVDTDRFVPRVERSADERATIGTVIRFSDIKDPCALVDAFALLADKMPRATRPRLLMVGDGPLLQDVQGRVRAAGLENDVELAGAQLDVLPWLQRMDIFALASRREGISNTILEAMSCGLPVVATETGGNGELVNPPQTGALVPVGDPAALAGALAELVRNPCRRRQAGACGRRRVLEQFSLNGMVQAYADLYTNELRSRA